MIILGNSIIQKVILLFIKEEKMKRKNILMSVGVVGAITSYIIASSNKPSVQECVELSADILCEKEYPLWKT